VGGCKQAEMNCSPSWGRGGDRGQEKRGEEKKKLRIRKLINARGGTGKAARGGGNAWREKRSKTFFFQTNWKMSRGVKLQKGAWRTPVWGVVSYPRRKRGTKRPTKGRVNIYYGKKVFFTHSEPVGERGGPHRFSDDHCV